MNGISPDVGAGSAIRCCWRKLSVSVEPEFLAGYITPGTSVADSEIGRGGVAPCPPQKTETVV